MTDPGVRPIIFGEVLFDVLPDGREVLGGAPFNVAWNLQGLGRRPLLVSRVGDDARGRRILDAMRAWGMDVAGIQLDPDHETGLVEVRLERGEATYVLHAERAYDFIDADVASRAVARVGAGMLVHGTLALRAPRTREALRAVTRASGAARHVDVNLRDPWWDRRTVDAAIAGARTIQLNRDELARLTGSRSGERTPDIVDDAREDGHVGGARAESGRGGEAGEPSGLLRRARRLKQRSGAQRVVVTDGARGAWRVSDGPVETARAAASGDVVDTIGAGDALCSALIALDGDTSALARAVGFASRVCRLSGATTTDRGFYALDRAPG